MNSAQQRKITVLYSRANPLSPAPEEEEIDDMTLMETMIILTILCLCITSLDLEKRERGR